ncbi:kinase-like domain-containing protein [Paraphysoderma sedebokerense]|nr:kinase-like domain-containing protein [Paraphysoderma sedebokerense]
MGKTDFLPSPASLSAKNLEESPKVLSIYLSIVQRLQQLTAPQRSKDKATRDSGIETPTVSSQTEDSPHSENTTQEAEAPIQKTEQPGQWNTENIQTIGQLGSGATARVSRALDMTTGKQYAIKTYFEHAKDIGVDEHEASILQCLDHPRIVQSFGSTDDAIVLEYVRGANLMESLSNHGPLNDCQARTLLKDLVEVLGYLHKNNIIYRDLKPENVMVGENFDIKLLDFGSAYRVGTDYHVPTTPHFVAPEVIAEDAYDSSADVYSLGLLLFTAVTGLDFFEFNPMEYDVDDEKDREDLLLRMKRGIGIWRRMVAGEQSQDLEALIASMIAVDPNERPSLEEIVGHPWTKDTANAVKDVELSNGSAYEGAGDSQIDDEAVKQTAKTKPKKFLGSLWRKIKGKFSQKKGA